MPRRRSRAGIEASRIARRALALRAVFRKRKVSSEPWRWSLRGRTLAVSLPAPWLVLGWAPLGGGFKHADLIVNHQIEADDRTATEAPRAHLTGVVRALGHEPRRA